MKWQPARIGDKVYDLSHLHPFSFDFVLPPKDGKPQQHYGIDVIFSCHCFTRGFRPGEVYVGERTYSDKYETRIFDPRRYTQSLRLPKLIRSIDERRCFHTGHGNFFTVEIVDEQGRNAEYTVYFQMSRAQDGRHLNLYVQTAYIQNGIPRPGGHLNSPTCGHPLV